jgi:hypothetical protein
VIYLPRSAAFKAIDRPGPRYLYLVKRYSDLGTRLAFMHARASEAEATQSYREANEKLEVYA